MLRALFGVGVAMFLGVSTAARAQCQWNLVIPTPSPNGQVICLAKRANGDLIAGGDFTTFCGGVAANHLAVGRGSTWAEPGGGVNGVVRAAVEMPNGDIVVAGGFTQAGVVGAGGVAANGLARWNGSTWSALGSYPADMGNLVLTMAALPNGDLVVGGWFNYLSLGMQFIARWNGTTWSGVGAGPLPPAQWLPVFSLAVRPQGDFVFCGWDGAYGTAASVDWWNGTSRVNLGSAQGAFRCVGSLPNGDVWLGGAWSSFGNVPGSGLARWNGATWTAGPPVGGWEAIDFLPSGGLVLKGSAAVQRFENGTWTSLASLPPSGSILFPNLITSMAVLPQGELAMGANVPPYFALLRTPCPATATPFGTGCAGSNGVDTLAATELPWTGGTFASRATGMPNLGVVAMVTGFTSLAIPLTAIFAQVAPGCTGYVSADYVDLLLPSGGEVSVRLQIPADPALVGVGFHQYAAVFETDAVGNVVAITSSNGLSMTVGAF